MVMGSARDIVEWCGVPRFLFSDFPLGNSAGKPHDRPSQRATLEQALSLFESATHPQTTVKSSQVWSEDTSWKEEFQNVAKLSAEEITKMRAAFDKIKSFGQGVRDSS